MDFCHPGGSRPRGPWGRACRTRIIAAALISDRGAPQVEGYKREKMPIYQIPSFTSGVMLALYEAPDRQGARNAGSGAASAVKRRPPKRAAMIAAGFKSLKATESRQPSLSLKCPKCGSDMVYAPRRVVDRLLHWIRPVHRYRCIGFKCGYEGNWRSRKLAPHPPGGGF